MISIFFHQKNPGSRFIEMLRQTNMILSCILLFFLFCNSISASEGDFEALLSGEEAGAITEASGAVKFHLSADSTELSYKLTVINIGNITMAHIHLSPPGQDGPPVVWLYPAVPPAKEIKGKFSGMLAEGIIKATDLVGSFAGKTIQDFVAQINNGMTYANVHTSKYPNGEIRSRIASADLMSGTTEATKAFAIRYIDAGGKMLASELKNRFISRFIASEQLKKGIAARASVLPDYTIKVDDIIVEGDKAVFRATIYGTHTGEGLGIPPTGKQVTIPFIAIYSIANDKVAGFGIIADQLGLMQQVGVVPAMGRTDFTWGAPMTPMGTGNIVANKAFFQRFLVALSGKDKPADLVDQYVSAEELKQHIAMLEAAFPRYEILADDIIAEGNRIVLRGTFRGTQKGDYNGIPATNKLVTVPLIVIYRIADGKIVEEKMMVDQLGLLQQLGVINTPS